MSELHHYHVEGAIRVYVIDVPEIVSVIHDTIAPDRAEAQRRAAISLFDTLDDGELGSWVSCSITQGAPYIQPLIKPAQVSLFDL